MNRVLINLYRQANIHKKGINEKVRLGMFQYKIMKSPKLEIDVYKRLGLYNSTDCDFYSDDNIYECVIKVQNMFLIFQLLNIQYVNLLDATCDNYRGITEIPIVAITPNEFVFEFKAPFDKNFFQKLIDDECDVLEFGDDFVKIHNNRCYATTSLYELFAHQPSKEVKRLRERLCKI